MAISIKCTKCKKTHKLGKRKCTCGADLTKHRKYKVQVKSQTGRWKTKTVATLDLAHKLDAKFKADAVEAKDLGIVKAPVIDEAWAELYKYATTNLKRPECYEGPWRLYIQPEFTGRKMDSISPVEFQRFKAKLGTLETAYPPTSKNMRLLSPSSIYNILKTLKRIYSYAEQMGLYRGINPTKHIPMPKFDNRRTNVLTQEELTRFVNVLTQWENRLPALGIHMALVTGKRMGEIFKLKWKRVGWESKTVTYITKSRVYSRKQSLPMNVLTEKILKEAEEYKAEGVEYVFHTATGKPIHYNAIWRRIKAKAELPTDFRPHDLRHTFASYLASSGEVDIYTLQNLLGHETIAMTQRYSHLMDGRLRDAVGVADRVLG